LTLARESRKHSATAALDSIDKQNKETKRATRGSTQGHTTRRQTTRSSL
jgi:hypothetical protein